MKFCLPTKKKPIVSQWCPLMEWGSKRLPRPKRIPIVLNNTASGDSWEVPASRVDHFGLLAVHSTHSVVAGALPFPKGAGYTVTHVPTGLKVVNASFPDRSSARGWAAAALSLFGDDVLCAQSADEAIAGRNALPPDRRLVLEGLGRFGYSGHDSWPDGGRGPSLDATTWKDPKEVLARCAGKLAQRRGRFV